MREMCAACDAFIKEPIRHRDEELDLCRSCFDEAFSLERTPKSRVGAVTIMLKVWDKIGIDAKFSGLSKEKKTLILARVEEAITLLTEELALFKQAIERSETEAGG